MSRRHKGPILATTSSFTSSAYSLSRDTYKEANLYRNMKQLKTNIQLIPIDTTAVTLKYLLAASDLFAPILLPMSVLVATPNPEKNVYVMLEIPQTTVNAAY